MYNMNMAGGNRRFATWGASTQAPNDGVAGLIVAGCLRANAPVGCFRMWRDTLLQGNGPSSPMQTFKCIVARSLNGYINDLAIARISTI